MKFKTLTGKNICDVCGKILYVEKKFPPFDNLVKHHVSYFPEIIIYVHGGCHLKIHRTNRYPKLKPTIESSAKFYNREFEIEKRRYK